MGQRFIVEVLKNGQRFGRQGVLLENAEHKEHFPAHASLYDVVKEVAAPDINNHMTKFSIDGVDYRPDDLKAMTLTKNETIHILKDSENGTDKF